MSNNCGKKSYLLQMLAMAFPSVQSWKEIVKKFLAGKVKRSETPLLAIIIFSVN